MDTLLHDLLERVFSRVFYIAGWLMLRLLTLGRYPRLPLLGTEPIGSRSSWVTAFGFFCLVGVPLASLVILYG